VALVLDFLAVGMATRATAWANDQIFTLRCELTSFPPRNGGDIPVAPFIQRFRINLDAGTVDGKKAVISSDRIGWEPRQPWFRPYATLTRPDWRYHSSRQIRQVPYEISGPRVVENSIW
jgi:hypothetical protein